MPEIGKGGSITQPNPAVTPPQEKPSDTGPVQQVPGEKHIPKKDGFDDQSKAIGDYDISAQEPLIRINANPVDLIVEGLNGVAAHELQGLPKSTLIQFCNAVSSRNMMLFTRFVEPISKTLIAEGWPTKHYRIKIKSGNWGMQAGTIPTNQAFSKKVGNPAKVEELNALSDKCLKDTWDDGAPVAVKVHLKITTNRINELEEKGYLYNREEIKDDSGQIIGLRFTTRERNEPDGKEHIQEAWLESDGKWSVYEGTGRTTPIEVLAQYAPEGEIPLPYTADADPLLEAFPLEDLDLGGKDKLPLPLISDQVVKNQVDQYRKRLAQRYEASQISEEEYQKGLKHYVELEKKLLKDFFETTDIENNTVPIESPNVGNTTPRTLEMIAHYQKEIDRPFPLIHHNVDAHSLATDEAANYPITAFFPKSMKYRQGVAMIFNEEQLIEVMRDVMALGYEVEKNLLWGNTRVNRPSFVEAQHALSYHLGSQAEHLANVPIDSTFDTSVDPSARAQLDKEILDWLQNLDEEVDQAALDKELERLIEEKEASVQAGTSSVDQEIEQLILEKKIELLLQQKDSSPLVRKSSHDSSLADIFEEEEDDELSASDSAISLTGDSETEDYWSSGSTSSLDELEVGDKVLAQTKLDDKDDRLSDLGYSTKEESDDEFDLDLPAPSTSLKKKRRRRNDPPVPPIEVS